MAGDGGTLGLPQGLPSDNILSALPITEVGEVGISNQPIDLSSYNTFVRWVNTEITRAEPHFLLQRERMNEAWKFNDGHQLSDEDIRVLRQARRPDTAINELQKFIKFATGIERRTQQALLF